MAVNDRCHVNRGQRCCRSLRVGKLTDRSQVSLRSPWRHLLRKVVSRSAHPVGWYEPERLTLAATWQHTPQPPGPRTQRREPHTWNVKEGQVVKVGVPKEVKNHE